MSQLHPDFLKAYISIQITVQDLHTLLSQYQDNQTFCIQQLVGIREGVRESVHPYCSMQADKCTLQHANLLQESRCHHSYRMA